MRQELVGVFKALDDSMDDAAIDELLSSADASGDGQLQIEEFLNWMLVLAFRNEYAPEVLWKPLKKDGWKLSS